MFGSSVLALRGRLWRTLRRSFAARNGRDLATALEAAEARYRHLVDNAPDIIYRTDVTGHFTFVNPMAEVIIGRPQSELLGSSYLDLIHPDDRNALRRQYETQWVSRTPTTYAEFRVETAAGKWIWIGQNVQLIVEGGRRTGFQAIARDITDRKVAQEAVARLQQQTESILNSAAEGIVSVDRSGRLVMLNPAAEQLTGYTIGEMRGLSARALLHHSQVDAQADRAAEASIASALASGMMSSRQTDAFVRRDGSSFQVEYTVMPIREGSDTTGAVLTFHDISERAAIERTKDEFIAVVSHELRTPLTSMRASLGLLHSGLLDLRTEQAKRMVDLAVSNTDRLIRLVNDILDVQRLTSQDFSFDKQRVNVSEIVERCVNSQRAVAESARIKIVESVQNGEVVADAARVVQALTNLVANAIKFSPPDSQVEVSVRFRDGSAVFSVRDYGRGIPANKVEALFSRFKQLDASDARSAGGAGLGLSIARMLVEGHGGQIWVHSTVGEGTTFWFTIPVMRQS
jgi:PAS domain S-box-containing protein